jgi:hypothetical protein
VIALKDNCAGTVKWRSSPASGVRDCEDRVVCRRRNVKNVLLRRFAFVKVLTIFALLSRIKSEPGCIVANVPWVVGTLPTSTNPRRSTPRAVVKPSALGPWKKTDADPAGTTWPFGVSLIIVVPVPWVGTELLKFETSTSPGLSGPPAESRVVRTLRRKDSHHHLVGPRTLHDNGRNQPEVLTVVPRHRLLQRQHRDGARQKSVADESPKGSFFANLQPEIRFVSGHPAAHTCTGCCATSGAVGFFVLHMLALLSWHLAENRSAATKAHVARSEPICFMGF